MGIEDSFMWAPWEEPEAPIPDFIEKCPVFAHWVTYNGKIKFAMLNYEESIKRGKAMIDLSFLHGY